MSASGHKDTLRRYLQIARDAMLWKLEGVGEYDARRPLVPTGTNLLGLVKHLAGVEAGYFGECFARPLPDAPGWMANLDEPNIDMWATAEESREQVLDLYRRVWGHADDTIEALALDDTGRVSWWPEERNPVTLHQILVHVTAETHRHAGHADILREMVDGAVGLRPDNDNMADADGQWWVDYRRRLEDVARQVAG